MKASPLTHVLLFLVLIALVLNLGAMLQSPARAAADDLSDVARQLDDLNTTLEGVSSELDGIQSELADVADADIFELRASSSTGATNGLPVVVVGG